MLCLSGFELYSRWVPLIDVMSIKRAGVLCIRYKTRGAAECFILDKARNPSLLNGFKNVCM